MSGQKESLWFFTVPNFDTNFQKATPTHTQAHTQCAQHTPVERNLKVSGTAAATLIVAKCWQTVRDKLRYRNLAMQQRKMHKTLSNMSGCGWMGRMRRRVQENNAMSCILEKYETKLNHRLSSVRCQAGWGRGTKGGRSYKCRANGNFGAFYSHSA